MHPIFYEKFKMHFIFDKTIFCTKLRHLISLKMPVGVIGEKTVKLYTQLLQNFN